MFSGVGILVLHNIKITCQFTILPNLKLLCQEAGFEVGLDDNLDLQLGPAHLPHQGNHSERQRDVFCGSIPGSIGTLSSNILINLIRKKVQSPHQLMLAVRRDEADGVLRLKLAQLHTPEQLK